MTAVLSERWHRVAALRPCLAPQLCVRRQQQRGQAWWLLVAPASGRSLRLSRAAYEVAARLDGRQRIDALWQALAAGSTEPPTQDEVIELLAQLREQGLLQGDAASGGGAAEAPDASATAGPADGERASWLAWRWRLGSPQALLDRLARPLHALPSGGLALAALALAVWALLQLALEAESLWHYGQRWAASPRLWLLALLLYPPIKALHELAHGLVARRAGAPVHEAGLSFFLGLPMPYVDVSASATLPRRRARLAIAAAGVVAELGIAALALALWQRLPDGLLREAAFAALGIAGLSTLLINGNPLQRLDGYHLFTEVLHLPNLAPRSQAWWRQTLQRQLTKDVTATPMPLAPGERRWLIAYAPAAWLWRLGLGAAAVAWVGQMSAALGVGLALALAWALALRPMRALWQALAAGSAAHAPARQRLRRVGAGLAALLVALLAVPLPQHGTALGVHWPPDAAQLRAGAEGFVADLAVADGQPVAAGEVVLRLENPRLTAERERLAAQMAALSAQWPEAAAAGGERAGNLQAELAAAQLAFTQAQARENELAVRARSAGRVALPGAADLPGQYIARGRLLGQVLTGAAPTVRMAVPEGEAATLPASGAPASVRWAERGAPTWPARLQRDTAGAQARLPSAALGLDQGGRIATDPQHDDGLRALQPVVLVDVQLEPAEAGDDIGDRAPYLGQRAWVRWDAGWAPLAWQWAGPAARRALAALNPWR